MFGVEAMRVLHPEYVEIDAARPQHHVVEAERFEVGFDRRGGRHHRAGRAVKPAQKAVGPGERNAGAGLDVFGKAGVIGGGERQIVVHRIAARGQTQRPFGGDVQRVRGIFAGCVAGRVAGQHRQADVRISGAGQGAEFQRGENVHLWPMASISRRVVVIVRTTPLTCGDQASVTIMTFMVSPERLR